MKVAPKKKILNSDSLENYNQMANTIDLFKAVKYVLPIHADSEESDNSLDYSRTFTTTINNPVIRELFQKQVKLTARIDTLRRQ